ncbi:hypothetical protein PTSG_12338 [Salpingoeca rosetta]|uniref:tRNA (Uracil-5-)-methyltransferase n=1 Tax=Salpingoeca rosetta (strain ATCC 50818 / BSB-021) TaxID=946362 RepID=F2UBJ2_SALR5|nr:uncharacterized protein PTSG_12338 [Salpingoeca rosetta]EGD73858.1 hypothetical protein PTSG_12338 [Salpingoeca rosetta]|eukprot:XP_004993421.1 hypothetical protein PTSG_12338 [Salpingoeca rosetta]
MEGNDDDECSLASKVERLQAALRAAACGDGGGEGPGCEDDGGVHCTDVAVEASPTTGYRYRCRFQLLRCCGVDGGEERYAFAVWKHGRPQAIHSPRDFTIACARIHTLMERVLEEANCKGGGDGGDGAGNEVLWQHCQAAHFHCTTTDDAMITFIYDAAIEDEGRWRHEAQRLSRKWGCHLLARSKGQRLVVGNDYVEEVLTLPPLNDDNTGGTSYPGSSRRQADTTALTTTTTTTTTSNSQSGTTARSSGAAALRIVLRQPEGAFSNPNPYICLRTMLWLRQRAALVRADVRHMLELYAGAGTYTPILGHLFDAVTTVEISTALVAAAQHNATANGVDERVRVVRAPVEAVRHIISSASHEGVTFDAVMLDPPRAGADAFTISCLGQYKHIILLSCNPLHTFPRDLRVLCRTHRIASAIALDHFPQTPHFEAAMHLIRR